MDMSDIISYLPEVSLVGIIALFIIFIRLKHTLKEELIDPAFTDLKKDVDALVERVNRLELNEEKFGEKFSEQFNEVKSQLSEQSQNIAKMQGTLDLLIQKLVK